MVHAVRNLAARVAVPAPTATLRTKAAAQSFAASLKSLAAASATTAPAAQTAEPAASQTAASQPDTSLKALFGQPISVSPPAPTPPSAPTAESVFGANPWIASPISYGPTGPVPLNPLYFATQSTAQKVAQMVGGTVVQSNQFTGNGGAFQQAQANWMVQLPNGNLINPGIVASFYTHGYPQSYIDGLIAGAVNNS
jgi:hypothetical protein